MIMVIILVIERENRGRIEGESKENQTENRRENRGRIERESRENQRRIEGESKENPGEQSRVLTASGLLESETGCSAHYRAILRARL